MSELLLIRHAGISYDRLEEIIKIKSQAWPYSFDKQLEWINSNLKDSDIHVLLQESEKNIAYLNLIEIEIKIDGNLIDGYGIGNVCVDNKGHGWGTKIMSHTNLFLIQNNRVGLLFCKKPLIHFYSLNNWKLIERGKLLISFDNESIATMIFNHNLEFQSLEYSGKPF